MVARIGVRIWRIIRRDMGKLVGRITSGATSHHIGQCLSMAYINIDQAQVGTALEVQVLERRVPATVIADSPYDPNNQKLRM